VSQNSRREARLLAVQFLFQQEFHPDELDLERALRLFFEEIKAPDKAREFASVLARGVTEHRDDLDERIRKLSENWDIRRMAVVDRNILRMAIYELLHRPDIPPVVSVNEAVDLAKELSSDESGKFVNGLLDRVLKTLDRPLRAAVGGAGKGKKKKG
jgi:transcription antitermination protein NusB